MVAAQTAGVQNKELDVTFDLQRLIKADFKKSHRTKLHRERDEFRRLKKSFMCKRV